MANTWESKFDAAEQSKKFQEKVKETYESKIQSLSAKIKDMEKKSLDDAQIKAALKKEKTKILQEAFDQALKEMKINKDISATNKEGTPITYLEAVQDAIQGPKIEAIYKTYLAKLDGDVDSAVDAYFNQKAIATGKVKEALTAIPGATAPIDFTSTNPEILRLQEFRAAREKALTTGKKGRETLLHDEAFRYLATTTEIDKLTSPSGGLIKDYDDGYNPFNKIEDENCPTRMRLNGFLYANYIFGGGGESGRKAVDEGIKEPYKLYYVPVGWSRLTSEDLEHGMGLKLYFDRVQGYTTFDRPLGMMAGLVRLIDQNVTDKTQHQQYMEYVTSIFKTLKGNDEDKQLQILFGIKSLAEQLSLDPNWKSAYNKIDEETIKSDYPGTDTTSPTRLQLNGYLYSVYLFNDKNDKARTDAVAEAAKIYDNSRSLSHPTKMFTQEHLEGTIDGGFNLGFYLKKAAGYSKFDTVKGAIAGLLKQADEISGDGKSDYQTYLDNFLESVSKANTEDNQLMILSSILSPKEANNHVNEAARNQLADLMINAVQQHNQFKFTPMLNTIIFDTKFPTLTKKEYEGYAANARNEINAFIKSRADSETKELNNKFQILTTNNSKLVKPTYSLAELDSLKTAIADNTKKFDAARLSMKAASFRDTVEGKYLESLTSAEKTYVNLGTELDTKLQVVKEGSSLATKPTTSPIESSPSTVEPKDSDESSEKPKPDVDLYTSNWPKAERVTPLFADYSGKLKANSTDPNEKVIGYSEKGARIATLNNDTEVTRTAEDASEKAYKVENLNFIRITYKDKKMWIPEEQLFQPE